jgi:hypothetical protein
MIFFRLILGNSGLDFGEDCSFPLIKGNDFIEFVTLFRKERQILLIYGFDQTNTELVLPGVFKCGIVVHILFERLTGTDNIIVGQIQENSLELKLFGTGSSQLVPQILFSNAFEDLANKKATLMSSA